MNTKITLDYKGEKYILEYDKESIKVLENLGVDLMHILSKPISNMDALCQCAFIKHHPDLTIEKMNKILECCPNKSELMKVLIQMVNEVCDIITGEPNEEDSKNVSWTVTEAKKPSVTNSTSEKTNE